MVYLKQKNLQQSLHRTTYKVSTVINDITLNTNKIAQIVILIISPLIFQSTQKSEEAIRHLKIIYTFTHYNSPLQSFWLNRKSFSSVHVVPEKKIQWISELLISDSAHNESSSTYRICTGKLWFGCGKITKK